ncbi:major facilitator superfamily domain-containing protein [Hyaloscypha finlandica]|nr:major facilitator superfamily domain-containing protein [Hyaloscypha finlandica]
MTNYNDPLVSRSGVVFAVSLFSVIASFLFVILRMISKLGILRKTSWDDYFVILAWWIAFGLSFSICFASRHGLGKRDDGIHTEWQKPLAWSQYMFTVLYNPALMATKTSILVFYLKVSENTRKVFRYASVTTLVVVNIAGLVLTGLSIFRCTPFSTIFDYPLPQTAKCSNILRLSFASAPVNIITDLAVLFLPIPTLTGLRLRRKQKIGVVVLFGLGGFVTVIDVLRIAYLQQASRGVLPLNKTLPRDTGNQDFAYYASLSFMWSAVEVNIRIICACIPTLKPLISRVPRLFRRQKSDLSIELPSKVVEPNTNPKLTFPTTAQEIPFPVASHGENASEGVDSVQFITTPHALNMQSSFQPTPSGETLQSLDMTFIHFGNPKSMVSMSNKESFLFLFLATLLSFLSGFEYGFLNTINCRFQQAAKMGPNGMIGSNASFFAGYFVAPLTFGHLILKRWGFKYTFIVGLSIYSCGVLVFWPSAVMLSYSFFIISSFIVGLGISTLDMAVFSFITLCGPPPLAEVRLNISQAVQAIGIVVSPILAQRTLVRYSTDPWLLVRIQWVYLGIAILCISTALAFYYLAWPEASDEELDNVASSWPSTNTTVAGHVRVNYLTLGLGMLSIFCFTGGQGAVYIISLGPRGSISSSLPQIELLAHYPYPFSLGPRYQNIANACLIAGRITAALFLLVFEPRRVLLFFSVGCVITAALGMRLMGKPGIVNCILAFFFESAILPTTFAICLRGLGSYTKTCSAFLIAAECGGAVLPAILNPILQSRGNYAWCVIVAAYSFALVFPLYLNLIPIAKNLRYLLVA